MTERVSRRDISINTIIGPNTDVRGDISAGGFTRVDGNVRGELDSIGRVVIGECARMKSNITGTAITVGGVVKGNVLASERLVVLSTGLILGDVITRRIQADEGCIIHGRITVCVNDTQWENSVRAYEDAMGVREALSTSGAGRGGN